MADKCERCWTRTSLHAYAPDGGKGAMLCRPCREGAPRDALVFREVYMRFGSAKELISHFDARDEDEALRKLCNEQRLDYRRVTRAMKDHGNDGGSDGFAEYTRPYGYLERDGGYVVKTDEARTVGLIFEMYLDGKGIAKICRELNEHDIRTKTGKKWKSQTVANILRNPLYCGYTRENGSLRRGKHRAIVDPEVFSRVQVEMEKRIRRPDQKAESRLFRPKKGGKRRSKR